MISFFPDNFSMNSIMIWYIYKYFMYIGPWQEYKLAHVIKLKNDIYDGNLASPKLTEQALQVHNERTFTTDSNSTDRTFISENIQKRYPRFNVDTYYKQWKHIEDVLTRSEATEITHKKPNVPRQTIRKRQPKSFQAQRVSKMRLVYGITEREDVKLPPIEKHVIKVSEEKPKEERLHLPPITNRKYEEIEEEQIDGLLQWVKELPEEISMCSSEMSNHALVL